MWWSLRSVFGVFRAPCGSFYSPFDACLVGGFVASSVTAVEEVFEEWVLRNDDDITSIGYTRIRTYVVKPEFPPFFRVPALYGAAG